ncbi:MAG: glycoside hydrolase family 13 protein [Lachnospirales bacterium]
MNEDYIKKVSQNQLKLLYANMHRTYIITDGIFSDESQNYVTPSEPKSGENIRIKLRTCKNNVDKAFIHIEGRLLEMTKSFSKKMYDFYEVTIEGGVTEIMNYAFYLEKEDFHFYYNKNGVHDFLDNYYNFKIVPDFEVPQWAKSSVMYQIYIDRFFNGDKSNDVVQFEYKYLGKAVTQHQWDEPITTDDVWSFYGGDLQGVIDKLDYLKDLGVEAIYFNPIFVSPSNHKYDAQDYDYVDPHIGVIKNDNGKPLIFENFKNDYATKYMSRTIDKENLELSNQLVIDLIETAHSKGIKVILDGVFNHCGAFNKWLDTEEFYKKSGYENGAFISKDSKYHDYFLWLKEDWPNNRNYDGWWGHSNHPKLNFEDSKDLEEYILAIGRKWVSPPFNADGWRLDVAADLGRSKEYNHNFWRKFRDEVKKANNNTVIIAEHYGDPSSWLEGDQWDTIMNYDAFMEPITWFLTGMEKHSEEFRSDLLCNSSSFVNAMRYHMAKVPMQSLLTSMNQLSNHDHSRFLTRTNMTAGRLHTRGSIVADQNTNIGIMYEAITFQNTWIGSPTVYYGDEVGLTGWTDPDNRRTFPWNNINRDIHRYYKLAIRLHKDNDALKYGSIKMLFHDYGLLCYARFTENEKVITILNNNNLPRKLEVPVWKIGVEDNSDFKVLLETTESHFNTPNYSYFVKNGKFNITLNKFSSVILRENIIN